MRTIYMLRSQESGRRTIAFSHRRAAERYRETIAKRKWKELTDFDVVGAARRQRLKYYADNGYAPETYEVERERTYLDREMQAVRQLVDAGFAAFRANYDYNYGPLPQVEEVKLYRTYADFNAPRE